MVGLTGTFGSGKSTVGNFMKRLGARSVIDSDRIAHEVFRPDHALRRKIKSLFEMGSFSRRQIAKSVFSDAKKRKRLEAVIHPYVLKRIRQEMNRIKNGVIVLEVPLLFEAHFDRMCDVTVSVLSGEKNILKRLSRSGFSRMEVRSRLRAQLPERIKK